MIILEILWAAIKWFFGILGLTALILVLIIGLDDGSTASIFRWVGIIVFSASVLAVALALIDGLLKGGNSREDQSKAQETGTKRAGSARRDAEDPSNRSEERERDGQGDWDSIEDVLDEIRQVYPNVKFGPHSDYEFETNSTTTKGSSRKVTVVTDEQGAITDIEIRIQGTIADKE